MLLLLLLLGIVSDALSLLMGENAGDRPPCLLAEPGLTRQNSRHERERKGESDHEGKNKESEEERM